MVLAPEVVLSPSPDPVDELDELEELEEPVSEVPPAELETLVGSEPLDELVLAAASTASLSEALALVDAKVALAPPLSRHACQLNSQRTRQNASRKVKPLHGKAITPLIRITMGIRCAFKHVSAQPKLRAVRPFHTGSTDRRIPDGTIFAGCTTITVARRGIRLDLVP